ncbi:hypothetical protein [Arthrobacter sp. NicSoilC12]|uniref:hypothetical protein n=1 Tax=Arthrobacter sp. NicSoilC12 TaxID=2831001 RepID=UPI001CC53414|nr:hypothetical protein [Arthrobacter sp. NicSoilC12]GIU56691.1 hypothetical protein NicSoilC12_24400 [Arthrobacter sp. NicSoilC12]
MGLSRAGGAGHLDPLLYPWDPPVASGVMDGNEFRPIEPSAGLDEALAQAGAAPLEARSLVVSIGSNSSADVMRRKFASYHQSVSAVLPLVRGQLHNIAVGHSAHVSKAGYIAAAPYPLLGESTAVWLSWLDDVQLMALDETEPNYRRIQLDVETCPLVLDHGERPEDFSLFTSRWGVLTDGDGEKLPFLDQPALFGLLAGSGTGDLLEEGKSVFDGPPEHVIEQLAIPSVQAWAREWFSSAGLAAPVDFDGPCAG